MHIDLVTIIVDDDDRAIEFFVSALGFELSEDSPSLTNDGRPKRWVIVRPPDGGTGILLARADGDRQPAAIGNQVAGRVGFFLQARDFDATHERMADAGGPHAPRRDLQLEPLLDPTDHRGEAPREHGQLVRSLLSAPDTGSFATDMRTMLRSFADLMDSEYGELLRGVLAEVTRSPELAAEAPKQLLESGPHLLDEIYQRGTERGEVRPELRGTRVMTAAHDLLRNEFMTRGTPIEDATIEEILDTVYLPLVRAR